MRISLVELGGEGARADPRRIGLDDADDSLQVTRAHTGTPADTARDRVARCHERICAVVEVEEGRLCGFEEHPLLRVQRLVHEMHRVVDQRLEPGCEIEVVAGEGVGIDGKPVVDLGKDSVLLPKNEIQLLPEDLGVQEVLDSQPDTGRLVGVRRTDAAFGRAELVLAQEALGHAVELLVVRHDQVRVAGQADAAAVDSLGFEHVELFDQHGGVDDDAVADHRHDPRIQHAARNELELEDVAVHDDRVAGVVAALVADTERGLFGEEIGELSLALVTPLGADDHRAGHGSLSTVAIAITLTRSYYPAPDATQGSLPQGRRPEPRATAASPRGCRR